jgi:hypothetical protein
VGDPARRGPEVGPRGGRVAEERHEGLNLTPPAEGFELYRHKRAANTATRGWSGLYWARRNEAGDYEIRSILKEGEGYSVTGGIFPKKGFEEHYERANL